MKTTIFFRAVMVVLIDGAIFLSGCQSPDRKVEKAEANVEEAKQELTKAQIEERNARFKEWQEFRNEAEAKIRENEKRIEEYEEDMQMKKLSTKYQNRIKELEQENASLRRRLYDYRDGEYTKWSDFKKELTYDIDQLGNALKNLTVDNIQDKETMEKMTRNNKY